VVLLNIAGRGKLGPKYYRPFHVSKHIDDIAYKLKLPQGTKLHDMFHVALLKTFHAPPPPEGPGVLPPIRHGQACLEPVEVTKCQLTRGRRELLVRWPGQNTTYASWMDLDDFRRTYPSF
jgi:hypothetical protein